MAPGKFGLFKPRNYQEQPSTENLLQNSNSSDCVTVPNSPLPSTSKCREDLDPADVSVLQLDGEDDDDDVSEKLTPRRKLSECSRLEETQVNYKVLKNQQSTDATSISTLQDDFDQILMHPFQNDRTSPLDPDQDGASTSCDANSLQFDEASIAPSEDISVYCGTMKKPKKSRSKEEKQMRDLDMWQASNVEVMENLLSRSGTLDDQIKWEAIATARGLCTLTDSCTCGDCAMTKYLAGVTDGDGGLGAAPLFHGIGVGCSLQ